MANQITINIGAAANDGTGEPLRSAFNDVNLNFANVWATGLPNSNVQFNNNRILTVNTNANLVLAPNGIGVVQSNVSILPNSDRVHNLGSSSKKWDSIYANYLDIDELVINNDLTVGGNLTVTGNIIELGNIVTDSKTIQLANTAASANAANGSGITVGANDAIATFLFNSANNAWATNIGLNVTGNIVPLANVTYSLGNATNWWSNVWVAGNTMYIGGVPVGMGAGNVLTVNGNAVLQNDSNTTISTTGNITADYFFGNGSQLTGINASSNKIFNGNSFANIATANGNVVIGANGNTWTFGADGNLTLSGNTFAVNYANGDPVILGSANTGQWAFDSDTAYNSTNNGLYIQASQGNNDGGAYFPYTDEESTTRFYNNSGAGIEFSAGANAWIFNPDASVQFPQIYTARGDTTNGNIYGYTLVIGDGENEAVITTPNGIGGDSVRLVINPGKGADGTSGEGGDIYLWAGRGGSGDVANLIGGGSGGDIKIRGGQGMAHGEGGYIRIEAGNGDNQNSPGGYPGFIEITAGQGGNTAPGGYVHILAGTGDILGGDANISGGTGLNGPGGNVNISSGGGATAGNVNVTSAGNTWTFDNSGNLTLPGGGIVYGNPYTPSGAPGNTITLQPAGSGTVTDQRLLIYPTAADGGHIHLASGNLYQTELFLGSDNLYVKLANTGNVVVNANDGTGNSFQYVFGADSTITFPDSGLSIDSGYNSGYAGFVAGSGIAAAMTELYSSGNTAAQILLNRPQVDHTIQLSLYPDSADPATTWTFDDTGNLTTPGSGGDIVMTGGNLHGANIVTANTFVSTAYNVVTAGNLFITSQYGLGTTGTILENNGDLEVYGSGAGGAIVGWTNDYNSVGNVATLNFNTVDSPSNILVRTGNRAGTEYNWTFDNTGTLTLPNTVTIKTTSDYAIAIGVNAGTGGSSAVSLGVSAGANAQSFDAIAIGGQAGANTQGGGAIAIGGSAGADTQGAGAIAIGPNAGQFSQGTLAIAIGASAGYNVQASSSIVINATGNQLDAVTANTLLIDPIRNDTGNTTNALYYNTSTKEVTYGPGGGGSYGNANVVANLAALGSNPVSTTGNVTAGYFIATGNANVLTLTTRNGDSNNSNASPQIIMGYAGTADYPQFIHTTHNASTPVDNNIEFWTSDGTQAGTFPANAVLGLTVSNGNIKTGGISAAGNILSNGYARLSGTFDESQASTAGLYLGYAGGTPRMMFGTGNTSQTLEIDNDGGTLRFYKPGTTLASLNTSGDFSATGNVTGANVNGQILYATNASGNEGGEINLAKPPNATISGGMVIDAYIDQLRFFEQTGTNRGMYVDLANSPSGGSAIGYRDIPQITLSGNVTANTTNAGKHFYSTTAGNLALTLPDNANVAFPTGATLTVVVNAAGNVLVNQGTGVTLYMAGSSTTGNRVVGAYGLASVMKVATNTWVISGTGVY